MSLPLNISDSVLITFNPFKAFLTGLDTISSLFKLDISIISLAVDSEYTFGLSSLISFGVSGITISIFGNSTVLLTGISGISAFGISTSLIVDSISGFLISNNSTLGTS